MALVAISLSVIGCQKEPACPRDSKIEKVLIDNTLRRNIKVDGLEAELISTEYFECEVEHLRNIDKADAGSCLSVFGTFKIKKTFQSEGNEIETRHYLIDRCGNTLFSSYD